jgi:CRP-like cAMP-binding protein
MEPLGRGMVQVPGAAARLPRAQLVEAVSDSPALRRLLAHYAAAAVSVAMHTAVCNARHPLRARLATWLLAALDRAPSGSMVLPQTQEFLAEMLGMHRASVNAAALALQADGLIRIGRGRVLILDRLALEKVACGCRDATRRRWARLLPGMPEEVEG